MNVRLFHPSQKINIYVTVFCFYQKKSCSRYFCTYGILLKHKLSILEAEIPRTRIAESKVIVSYILIGITKLLLTQVFI